MKRVTQKKGRSAPAPIGEFVRGTVAAFQSRGDEFSCSLVLIISNDIQNAYAESVLVIPLELRKTPLNAPFAVDLGTGVGLGGNYCARCDLVFSVNRERLESIVRAKLPHRILSRVEDALRVAFGFAGTVGVDLFEHELSV